MSLYGIILDLNRGVVLDGRYPITGTCARVASGRRGRDGTIWLRLPNFDVRRFLRLHFFTPREARQGREFAYRLPNVCGRYSE